MDQTIQEYATAPSVHERAFLNYCLNAGDDKIPEIESALEDLSVYLKETEDRIDVLKTKKATPRCRKALGRRQTDVTRIKGCIAKLVKDHERFSLQTDVYRKQWRDMLAVPRVADLWFKGCTLSILTDDLYSCDKQNIWHRVGPVTISVPLNGTHEQIRWVNMNGPCKVFNGPTPTWMQAPAGVKEFGDVSCYGNALEEIKGALNEKAHVKLVEVVVRYTECTGQYDNAKHWPAVELHELPEWYVHQFITGT